MLSSFRGLIFTLWCTLTISVCVCVCVCVFVCVCVRVCRGAGAVAPGVSRRPLTADPRVPFTRHTHTDAQARTHASIHTRFLPSPKHRPPTSRLRISFKAWKGVQLRVLAMFFFFFFFLVLSGANHPTVESCRMSIKFAVREGKLICKRSNCLSAKWLRRLNCNISIIRKFASTRITHKLYTMQTFTWEVTFYWI